MDPRLSCRVLARAMALAFASITALHAVDGVVLIDQNRALAGNVTPGDAPGFPITISVPGSYRLSGNITIPSRLLSAFELTSHVTLDLNGFAILGPVDCSGGVCLYPGITFPVPPGATGPPGITVIGISQTNITIRNGTIQGMGGHGIYLKGSSFKVEDLHVRSNYNRGIQIDGVSGYTAGGSIVSKNTVERNGGSGIGVEDGVVSENVVQENFSSGIVANGSARLERNHASGNGAYGLAVFGQSFLSGNISKGNATGCTTGAIAAHNTAGDNLCSTPSSVHNKF